jgi:hypothetical protein
MDDDDDTFVLRSALLGLDHAISRHVTHRNAAASSKAQADLGDAFGSLVECTFWIATLDEWLYSKHAHAYKALRDQHQWGGSVRAMLWARDRHYHQLPFSTERDTTPFIGHGIPGVMFYISPGLVWRSADALAETVDRDRRPQFRPDYEEHAQGKGTATPAARAREVFRDLARQTDMLPDIADTD